MTSQRRTAALARARMQAEIRSFLAGRGFEEVETPCLVPAPGMEPHIRALETSLVGETGAPPRRLWLHTSPEYAMKRLLAEGWERIFQLCRVFRSEEPSSTHNPEFTMLEMYRAGADYQGIMQDLEELVACCARAGDSEGRAQVLHGGASIDLTPPFERLPVAEAFSARAGIDLLACDGQPERLRTMACDRGYPVGPTGESFEDVFFRVFLAAVEPGLGFPRATYLVDWPAPMASLSKLKRGDPRVAERFELYVAGMELANGFTELNDPAEQRRRLEEEQSQRRQLGLPVYPIDERFLEAVGRMPDAGGVALGFDRLLMLLTGASSIAEVLLFPAHELPAG
jgi:elongation factor P--(R)-beta-lysine ligase